MNRRGGGRKGKQPPQPQPQPQKKRRSLSPTRLCHCSRFLSNRRSQSLPPNSTSCPSCFTSQSLKELERWDKILDEELERRMKELEMIGELVLVSEQKLEKEFRLQEIDRITSLNFDAMFPKTENAHKMKALMRNEAVESLYVDEKESLNKQIEELQLKKDQLQRDMKKIPKQSKFFREARKKKREQQTDDDDDSDFQLFRIP